MATPSILEQEQRFMDMQASRQLAVTQQQAWDALNDPEVLKLCIPVATRSRRPSR
jgi:carbon monoxide dehydrogenase subunit G